MSTLLQFWIFRYRFACVALALVALAFRALVPVGFMVASPAMAGQLKGAIPIVLCSMQGNSVVFMGQDGVIISPTDGDPAQDDNTKSNSHADCMFAAGMASVPVPKFMVLHQMAWSTARHEHFAISDLVPGRGLAAPPPPATAPPTLI